MRTRSRSRQNTIWEKLGDGYRATWISLPEKTGAGKYGLNRHISYIMPIFYAGQGCRTPSDYAIISELLFNNPGERN